MYTESIKYDLGSGAEAFSTRREGIQCGRIINAIRINR